MDLDELQSLGVQKPFPMHLRSLPRAKQRHHCEVHCRDLGMAARRGDDVLIQARACRVPWSLRARCCGESCAHPDRAGRSVGNRCRRRGPARALKKVVRLAFNAQGR